VSVEEPLTATVLRIQNLEHRVAALEDHPAVSIPPLRPGRITWVDKPTPDEYVQELARALAQSQRLLERAEKYAKAIEAQHKEALIRLSEARSAVGVAADALIIAASCPSSTPKDAP
jgi:hypothetical protein